MAWIIEGTRARGTAYMGVYRQPGGGFARRHSRAVGLSGG